MSLLFTGFFLSEQTSLHRVLSLKWSICCTSDCISLQLEGVFRNLISFWICKYLDLWEEFGFENLEYYMEDILFPTVVFCFFSFPFSVWVYLCVSGSLGFFKKGIVATLAYATSFQRKWLIPSCFFKRKCSYTAANILVLGSWAALTKDISAQDIPCCVCYSIHNLLMLDRWNTNYYFFFFLLGCCTLLVLSTV